MATPLDSRELDRRQLRRLLALVSVGFVALAGLIVLGLEILPADGRTGDGAPYRGSAPPGKNVLPEFDLARYDGGRLNSASLQGKIVLLTLLDSQCEEACPILVSVIARSVDQLSPSERDQVEAVAISVDPAEDTPQAVHSFLSSQRAVQRLDYLIGTEDELRPLWTALSVLPSVDTGQDSMHSAPLRIYSREGVWVSTLHAGADLSEQNLVHDVRTALAGEGKA